MSIIVLMVGLILVTGGALCRQVAMATCGSNFHHKIQQRQRRSHVLVQKGIYKYLRHPSYVGWFYWSIGTQCILLNPVCVVLYTLAAWHFFRIRIPYEEELLQRQYPHEYAAYMEVSYIGIPFIWSRKCVTTANTSTTSSSSSSSVTTSGRTTMTSITSSSSKAHQILGDKEQ
jgi:protein-S-isoprenylcysteine O-methyltransferase Ste14